MAYRFCLLPFLLVACASYQTKVEASRTFLRTGELQKAANILKLLAEAENDDQLVYLFDYGTVLQNAGQYKESNAAFLKAEKIADIVDYHSISRQFGSLVLNEGMIQYKGDDYEKVMINAMLAVNFLMLHDSENALVETRRLNEKLYKYRYEAKRPYEQNSFAFYLSALIWENDFNYDNAYIDYVNAFKVQPNMPFLHNDLIRAAEAAQRPEELQKWRAQFPREKINPHWRDKNYGEIVLIYEQGWGPRKNPSPQFAQIPRLYPVRSQTTGARLIVEGAGSSLSQNVFSVEDVSIKTLNDQYAGLIAKRVAGLATKVVIADQIAQKNPLLGQLTLMGLNLADQADLRQWSTLPESFQIARILVPAGVHTVSVQGLSEENQPTSESKAPASIVVKSRQKSFLLWRSYR